MRLWTSISPGEKRKYSAKGCAFFPEITAPHSSTKFQRFALWLVTDCSIVNTNIRDSFTAGGRGDVVNKRGNFTNQPQIFCRINDLKYLIKSIILNTEEKTLESYWETKIIDNPIVTWCKTVTSYQEPKKREGIFKMLGTIFEI